MIMADVYEVLNGLKPVGVMVLVQIAYAGMNIFYQLAANDGMNLRILVAYRMLFATAFIAPLAFILERKSRPKLTWMVLFQAFLCGLFGGLLAQNLYIESLYLTSATFATAMANLVPAFTFILAISFRMEKLIPETKSGKAKALGTLMAIGGAMLLTFYKGAEITLWSTHVDLMHRDRSKDSQMSPHTPAKTSNQLLGSLSALGSCFSYAFWLIIQTKMSKRYPCHYSSTALMSIMGSIQCVIFALCMKRELEDWKLSWNIRLYAAAYSGIVTSGLAVVLVAWCVLVRGPVFVSVFQPLALLLVAIAASLVLDEKLHFGSILGAALIVCGLYIVLWGKSKEIKQKIQVVSSKSSEESEIIEIASERQFTSNSVTNGNSIEEKQEMPEMRETKV